MVLQQLTIPSFSFFLKSARLRKMIISVSFLLLSGKGREVKKKKGESQSGKVDNDAIMRRAVENWREMQRRGRLHRMEICEMNRAQTPLMPSFPGQTMRTRLG